MTFKKENNYINNISKFKRSPSFTDISAYSSFSTFSSLQCAEQTRQRPGWPLLLPHHLHHHCHSHTHTHTHIPTHLLFDFLLFAVCRTDTTAPWPLCATSSSSSSSLSSSSSPSLVPPSDSEDDACAPRVRVIRSLAWS